MTGSKNLSDWLAAQGLISKGSAPKPAPKTNAMPEAKKTGTSAPSAKPAPKPGVKNTPRPARRPVGNKPAGVTAGTAPRQENRRPSGPRPSQRPDGQKSTAQPSQRPSGSRPSGGRSGGGRRDRHGATTNKFRTNFDPFTGTPSHDKRDAQHVVNFMKPGNYGDIRVVPLGGMEQVGLNMMFIEWGDDIVVIDNGFLFPSPEHLGIDVLIPDISYLIKKKKNIRGVIYTHGHLDHIGAVPYLIPELGFPPMFSSRLTKEMILANCDEFKINNKMSITEINPKSKIRLGRFEFEFFHVNHSIPGNLGIVANTPYGAIVHTSDFKIDHNPSDDQPCDLPRIAEIGKNGVALAMVDSTNAMKPGHTNSESVVEKQLEKIVAEIKGRVIVTTFASSVGRVAKLIEAAERMGRTVFLSGRSMEKNVGIARKLNYLRCKDNTIQQMSRKANSMDPRRVLILSTGSQGEELAALTRMAAGAHRDIKLGKDDTIIFSSSPIPGNEVAIVSVRNNLAEIGVNIIDHKDMDIYVSGHGYADECKTMTSLLNPKYFAPIHGEIYMRHGHRDLVVKDLGMKEENTFIMKNGQGVVINGRGARLMTEKEKIDCPFKMVELHEHVGEHVLADRQQMANAGCFFITLKHGKGSVKNVDIRARGFIYMHMEHEIFGQLQKELKAAFERQYTPERSTKALEEMLQKAAVSRLYQTTKKEPVVEVVVNG